MKEKIKEILNKRFASTKPNNSVETFIDSSATEIAKLINQARESAFAAAREKQQITYTDKGGQSFGVARISEQIKYPTYADYLTSLTQKHEG